GAEECAAHAVDGREGADGRTLLGDRRHLGPPGRELRDGEEDCPPAHGARARFGSTTGRGRLPPRQRRDHRRHREAPVAPVAGARAGVRIGRRQVMVATRKLELSDIKDMRAYEHEREDFRRHVIELKKRRRIPLGTIMTIVFENRDTMRFQVQEMARAERMLRDEQIAHELETYNALIPDPGELSATLLIELQSDEQLREWLPKLVGIH